jgi:hypothetical protein
MIKTNVFFDLTAFQVRPIYAEERRVAKQELTHMAREDELMR